MILASVIVALLAMAIVGYPLIRWLLPRYETLDLPEKISCSLVFGWPLFLFAVIALAFFYVGVAVFIIMVALGSACLIRNALRKPRRGLELPAPALSPKTIAWVAVTLTCVMVMYSAVVMAWPSIGDVITGHAPRTALFQLNQKVPLYPSPYLILYPPGFSALCATLNSAFGEVPAVAVLAVGASILVSVIIGVFVLSYRIIGWHVAALLPVGFVFMISPDVNMERWIVGHYLSGTYANFVGYLILISYIIFMFFFTRPGGRSYPKLLAMLAVYSVALLFTYPPFLVYVLIFTVATLALSTGRAPSWGAVARHGRLLLLLCSLLVAVPLIVLLTRGSYVTTVVLGYIAGSYVLGGSGVFGTYTAYVLPYQAFLADWRNWVLILSLGAVLYEFRSKRDAFSVGVFAVPTVCIIASIVPPLSGYLWFFFSSRAIALFQVLAFIYLCYFARERVYARLVRVVSARVRGPLANSGGAQRALLFALLVIMIMASTVYANSQAGGWGWYTKTPYFPDDIGGVQYVCGQTAIPDLIMGDNSPASQYIMTLGVRNLTCFDYVRVSQPDLYSSSTYYWDHPEETGYLLSLISSRNVSWIILCSDPWQVRADEGGNIFYRMKPFPQETYLAILDGLPFLYAEYQSGGTRCYRVIGG